MNNIYNENTSVSAYRMFEVLKFLMQKPASVQEIKEHLEKLDNGKIYSKNVIYKYLTTLKFAGMYVKKNKCKYEITKFPFKFDFNDNDLKALGILNKAIDYVPENEISDNLKTLFYRLNMRFTLENKIKIQKYIPNTTKMENISKQQKTLVETYTSYCKDNYRYSITMKNIFGHTEKIIAEPIETFVKNSQVYLKIFCTRPNRYLELNVKQILKIEALPHQKIRKYSSSTTIYKLTNKLAKRYTLRNGETIDRILDDESIIIKNNMEPKNLLFLRLLRYDECCEIISPKQDRETMKQLIEKSLNNFRNS